MSIPLLSLTSLFPESNHLSVPSDVLVFVFALIQTQLIASVRQGTGASDILDTVTRDAVLYFILISTSHFLILIMLAVARVRFFVPVLEFDTC